MDALDNLLGRYSTPAKQLVEPAPNDAELNILFRAAVTAPDHCSLQPWRFLVIRDGARQRLGDVFVEAYQQREPTAPAAKLETYRLKPLRAPMIIAVVARLQQDNPKVPAQEQLLSAGIAAQNIQLAARALGYHSIWLTGINCRDHHVNAALGLDFDEQLIAYLYIGSEKSPTMPPERAQPEPLVTEWLRAQPTEEPVI